MNKKILALSLLCGAVLLVGAGCAQNAAENAVEREIEEATNGQVQADIDVEGDSGEITITSDDGDTVGQFGEDLELPSDLPETIPVYENATLLASTHSEENDTHILTFTSTDDFAEIQEYFKSEIDAEGWTIDNELEMTTPTNLASYSCTQGDYTMTVALTQNDEGTTILVSHYLTEGE